MSILGVQTTLLSSPGTGDALVDALATHFGLAASLFTVSNSITGNGLDSVPYSSFTLTPKDVGETWQLNIRYGELFASFWGYEFTIDPAGTITNSGDLTGASASAQSSSVAAGSFGGTSVYVGEIVDAVYIFGVGAGGVSDGTGSNSALHAGKVMTPLFGNDPTLNMDGLGIFLGPPSLGTDNAFRWLTVADITNSANLIRVEDATWATVIPRDIPENMGMGVWRTKTRPDAIPLFDGGGVGTTAATSKFIGIMKYCFTWSGTALTPGTRWRDPVSGQTFFLLAANSTATRAYFIPWEDGVVPA